MNLWSLYKLSVLNTKCFVTAMVVCGSNRQTEMITYLSLHLGPALLLLFAFSHVLVLLLRLGERLQELVKDAKELIWLHLAGILTEVLYCPQELWGQRERGGTQDSIYSGTWQSHVLLHL